MNVHRIGSIDDAAEAVVRAAIAALDAGGLIVYPTDTLYALGCRADDAPGAVQVRAAKGRDEGKPLPIVAASLAQVRALCPDLSTEAAALAGRFWPGPLTLVLPLAARLPAAVTCASPTIAVRVPGAAFVRAVCEAVGPLVSTSANRSGAEPPRSFRDAANAVGHVSRILVDAGTLSGPPSTIVDATGEPRLVREGAVSWAVIRGAF